MLTLNQFIKLQRIKHKFTQEYLASELGISRPTYIQIEQGKRELTVSEAVKLAAIFEMTLENFVDVKEPSRNVTFVKNSIENSDDLQIRVTEQNLEKFKQVLLYVLNKVGSKPNVGETVLHKLLYFIDFDYYEKFEENLMGATYIKNHHGPTSVELGHVLEDMQKQNEIEAVKSQFFKYQQKKYLPRRLPDLDILSARDTSHIDDVLARLSDKNAREIEHYSHGDIPWRVAQNGKPISYESVFYRDEQYSVRNYDDEI